MLHITGSEMGQGGTVRLVVLANQGLPTMIGSTVASGDSDSDITQILGL